VVWADAVAGATTTLPINAIATSTPFMCFPMLPPRNTMVRRPMPEP
jgi:hypothetical protein